MGIGLVEYFFWHLKFGTVVVFSIVQGLKSER